MFINISSRLSKSNRISVTDAVLVLTVVCIDLWESLARGGSFKSLPIGCIACQVIVVVVSR